MSLIPSFFGNRPGNAFDPFRDFSTNFPFSSALIPSGGENTAFVNTRIDWKETPEAHVFKADLPGLKKEEVKVEVEDDRVLQISGCEICNTESCSVLACYIKLRTKTC
ncbi:unnamed protein product [Linum tenue]|uniref:SHSP domain-containing protein n=1 Tax=Linum tenue TaxID=586396 RepID=A0AAV0Q845_9ROSI|nr:unnamed protein product [Linum tenue]